MVPAALVWVMATRAPGPTAPAARSKSGARVAGQPTAAERLPAPSVVPGQRWRLAPDLGRRYAAVSGDFNPIHLSPATSRLFGFRRPIIHGMWTHARALAGLGRVPDAYRAALA